MIFSDPLETTVLYPSLFTSHFSTPQLSHGTFYSLLLIRNEFLCTACIPHAHQLGSHMKSTACVHGIIKMHDSSLMSLMIMNSIPEVHAGYEIYGIAVKLQSDCFPI